MVNGLIMVIHHGQNLLIRLHSGLMKGWLVAPWLLYIVMDNICYCPEITTNNGLHHWQLLSNICDTMYKSMATNGSICLLNVNDATVYGWWWPAFQGVTLADHSWHGASLASPGRILKGQWPLGRDHQCLAERNRCLARWFFFCQWQQFPCSLMQFGSFDVVNDRNKSRSKQLVAMRT